MSDLKAGAKEMLGRAKETVSDAAERVQEKAAPVLDGARERAAALKERAEPALEKVKDGAANAVEALKEGAECLGGLLDGDAPARNIRNELFGELEQEVAEQRDAAKAKAEEMQRRLEALMRGE